MSRAFVKEEGEGRWEPRVRHEFRVVLVGPGEPRTVQEGDDLLDLLRWAGERERGEYEVRDARGERLAVVG